MLKNMKLKHIVVSEENYEKLKKLGKFHNSFNDVITDVLKKRHNLIRKLDPGIRLQP